MAGQSQRLNVVPTVTMLVVVKHALLKKKSDALTVQFCQSLKKIVSTKESMGTVMKFSSFALTEAKDNALENVVKPRLDTVIYNKGELDELEREDFFRLKKKQGYKKREIKKQKEAAKKFNLANEVSLKKGASLLAGTKVKDEDIFFFYLKVSFKLSYLPEEFNKLYSVI
ncbi:hypothetical protein L1987_72859 [Smallanthus sonchifolius]|uniref:Uncharacterized protein n=1 Tax=Smallanthus sonchifolius TaxID=185202 RepID=A0ACB9AVK6_9ASTR|nr:hypothetical protein L1987_72859 [Smallanthus sonchifolius]